MIKDALVLDPASLELETVLGYVLPLHVEKVKYYVRLDQMKMDVSSRLFVSQVASHAPWMKLGQEPHRFTTTSSNIGA